MKKVKFISFALVIMFVFSTVFSVTAITATQGTYDDFKYSVLDNGTVEITQYVGKSKDVTIPSTINGYSVSSIGDNSFRYCEKIESVKISDSIKNIGYCAFDCCYNLSEITIPASIETIGEGAFFSCTRLENVNISNGVKKIGDGAFYDCKSLKSIDIPNSVQSIGEYAFGKCTALSSARLGDGISELSNLLFINCEKLSDIYLTNNLKKIGRKVFYNCNSLNTLELPDTVTTIGFKAFAKCNINQLILPNSLKKLENAVFDSSTVNVLFIPKNLSELEENAFMNADIYYIFIDQENKNFQIIDDVLFNSDGTTLLKYPKGIYYDNYTMPKSVTKIGAYAFFNSNVSDVNFNDNLKIIDDYAFSSSSVTDVVVPSSVIKIGDGAFFKSNYLSTITIPGSVENISANMFSESSLSNIDLGEGIKTISQNSFNRCYSLETINIPASVTYIDARAFNDSSLKDIYISDNSNNYFSEDGVLFNKDKTELVLFAQGRYLKEYSIPESVTSIGDYACCGYSGNNIYVPNSVKQIGDYGLGYETINYKIDRVNQAIITTKNNQVVLNYANDNNLACYSNKPEINKKNVSLKAGETFTLNISNVLSNELAFSSSNQNVAIVDQQGKITAVSKGETTIVANVGINYFECLVNVTSGSIIDKVTINTGFDTSVFNIVANDNYDKWCDDYYKFNSNSLLDPLDSPSIVCYVSEEYVPIMAIQRGGSYIKETEKEFDGDYEQYKIISDNLSYELSRFNQNTNVVLYSGTNNVSNITGATSSVTDMIKSIGKTVDENFVISTSIDYGVTTHFGSGSYHTTLEFYAPKLGTKGAYLQKIGGNEFEYELLLNKGNKFKVIDAGVRKVNFTTREGVNEDNTERFIKLAIVNDSSPIPTEPTSPTTQPNTKADKHQVPTGQSNNGIILALVAMLIMFGSLGIIIILRKKHKQF